VTNNVFYNNPECSQLAEASPAFTNYHVKAAVFVFMVGFAFQTISLKISNGLLAIRVIAYSFKK